VIEYEYSEHEEVKTSEDAASIRGIPLSSGAKALILKGKKSGTHYMVVIPGDKKIAMDKASEELGEKVEFEKPDTIQEIYGIKVGGVPPFGNVLGMRILIDKQTAMNPKISFNAGMRTCSISMSGVDLAEVTDGEVGEYAEN
jgi:nondiscriminating aspartyl-tRNA synthetase